MEPPLEMPQDTRQRLAHCVHHLEHVLPSQAALRDFVHHNTLHGFQHLPFPKALVAASQLTGAAAWLPEDECRRLYGVGRIDAGDLDAALNQLAPDWGVDIDEVLLTAPAVSSRDVLRAGLIYPLGSIPLPLLKWQIEERQALTRLADEVPAAARKRLLASGAGEVLIVADLWAACLDVFELDHAFDHPEELLELSVREEEGHAAIAEARQRFAAPAAALWQELAAKVGAGPSQADASTPVGGSEPGLRAWGANKVGAGWTVGALLKALTAEDALERVRSLLLRHLGAHLDQGLAPWNNPARPQGFYAAWRASAQRDIIWELESLPEARSEISRLPDDAGDCVIAVLTRLGLPEDRWPAYLECLALELPGWSGMFLWRHNHPGYAGTKDVPVAMMDYLAVRLVLESLVAADCARRHWNVELNLTDLGEYFHRHPAELWVRHAVHSGELPEYLLDLIAPHLPATGDAALPQVPGLWVWLARHVEAWRATPTVEQQASHSLPRSVWPLFRLVQHLGLSGNELRAFGRSGAEAMLACLDRLDQYQRGFVWLNAYERHYREQIFAGLAANHGRWPGHQAGGGPTAQLVFCMDDREEGMRRHLEEVNPQLETLGGAAHFAVFQNYYGLDDSEPTPLCPVVPEVIVPSHNVHEVPRADAAAVAEEHRRRNRYRLRWQDRLHQVTRTRLVGGTLLSILASPLAFAGTLLHSFAPGAYGRISANLRRSFDLPVATQLDLNAAADARPATPALPRDGFTDSEQAERIAGFLTSLGLTKSFAPLVVIMGHGANSLNNPHLSAYDCGACAGRHSGPNARLFAAMANRSEVRALMRGRGIDIPDTTWFLGAEHNTTDDLITWYDTEDIAVSLAPTFAQLDRDLVLAVQAHAQERCRRLYSAPLDLDQAAALRHAWERRNDWSQARPELGHATNACAFFGRRAMSRGAFFDRRSFLISYDPTQDPDGKVLERHLLINGAVGAGISLEYFFSTVNNEQFGCGSKVTHNVAGYFGVMQGASSDLATGLPKQMIEVHEAMRLLVVIEQTLDIITAVYQRQPPLQELVGNGWVIVAAKDPQTGAIHQFDPASGWLPWQGELAVETVKQSVDWFAGHREPLPPVLLERPLETVTP
ncbi:MAG: DUF2309 domain-containing protein [Gammaproteobacteria bacterium]|nr:DUF2309 domain-containing protein [Rhodocyclaceae bacterium]MBU3908391.1 DUF2309 domain-containing protein [Gammaproteobacteria bacterium]MBU4004101.1 DUF2309 domain-containing protein [Gammaproteobacteria bacterium]MBU4020348.1 DUF2309 domain-containing protein [Gammaproteobacteria bacterium]MBU4094696.1 DUF2309 domain-containing protein [Gammaproteobacteria bacterium]